MRSRTGELLHNQHGSEDLLLGDAHVVIDIDEAGGRDDVAFVAHLVAASHKLCALLIAHLDIHI